MRIVLVFITFNRLEYTKLALASVLADPTEEFSLTIWDNGSTDGTVEYLKNEVNDPRIADIILSRENVGQRYSQENKRSWVQNREGISTLEARLASFLHSPSLKKFEAISQINN